MYRVTKQYTKGPETDLQTFAKRELALQFIIEKAKEDARFKIVTTYRIYDDLDILLKEINSASEDLNRELDEEKSAAGAGSSQRFSPTPLNVSPTLGPRTWLKDEPKDGEDEEGKK